MKKRPCGYVSSLRASLFFFRLFFAFLFHPISLIPLVENYALIDALDKGKVL
jgi:hypothetical protein